MTHRTRSIAIAIVLSLSLFVRLAHFAAMKHGSPIAALPIVDSAEYVKTAEYILDKNPWGPPSASYWHPPLYYYFVATAFCIAGRTLDSVRLLQILMDVLNTLLLFLIARRIFDHAVAVIAAVFYALYVPLIFYCNEIVPPVLMITLLLLSIWLLLIYRECGRRSSESGVWWLIGASACLGLLIVTQTTFMPVAGLVAVWLAVAMRKQRAWPRVKCVSLFLAVVLAPAAAATARNYLVAGEHVVIAHNGGINFYIGNNADISSTLSIRPGFEWDRLLMQAYVAERIPNFGRQQDYWYRQGLDYVRKHPLGWLCLLLKKTVLFFNAHEFPRNFDMGFFSRYSPITRLPVVRLNLILPLALVAIALLVTSPVRAVRRSEMSLLLLVLFGYTFMIVLTFVAGRYRLPVIPILVIFAAALVVRVARECVRKDYRILGKTIILTVTMAIVVQIKYFQDSYPYEIPRSGSYVQISTALIEAGDVDRAQGFIREGLELPEDRCTYELYYNLGQCYYKRGQHRSAIDCFLKAWELNPGYYDALNALGFRYKELNLPDSAIYYLERATTLAPGRADIYFNLADCHLMKRDRQKAIEVLESFRVRCPSPIPIIGEGLGKLYMQSSEWELAARNLAEAIEYPQGYEITAEIYHLLGICYYRMRDFGKARDVWQKGLKLDPAYEPIRRDLMHLPR